jgi:hypothetical protein
MKDPTLCHVIRCDKPIAPTSKKHCAAHAATFKPNRGAVKPCAKFGCPATVHPSDGRFCPEHQNLEKKIAKRRYEDKKNDPTWQLYQTPEWKRFRAWFLTQNVICQLIEDGRRCYAVANTVHHLKPVRKFPELMVVAANCVALCAHHHDHRSGEDENDQRTFAPTKEDI